jgi:carboxyl-terminal processing protease
VVRFQDFVNRRENTNITFVAYNDVIKTMIKANLGRQLYDDNTYFEIINSEDLMVEEVLLLSKEEPEL